MCVWMCVWCDHSNPQTPALLNQKADFSFSLLIFHPLQFIECKGLGKTRSQIHSPHHRALSGLQPLPGARDPDYENITLAFKNQDHAKGGHSRPTSQVPAQCRPPSDSTQVPSWLYRAILSLYILLALAFILCIILSAFIMVKNAEMSKELLGFKRELWNVSNSIQACEERQKGGWDSIQQSITMVRSKVEKLEKLLAGNIDAKVQKILEVLQKMPQSSPQ
ncbi:mast cell-expressed membrane protein 1 isoform X1 [Pongo abelii]|uniref:mast cell-expressed membrane protein 1 isoform X1 n=1 Tax=Pongo abelii TaxID=9601 RepID=UPI0023E83C9B|nr:mast cell-expressed membrane protein 1 isoform X1 [Pongo abelii]